MSRQTSEGEAPVALVVALFGLSRAAYYAAKKRLETTIAVEASATVIRTMRSTAARFASAETVLAAIRAVVTEHRAWGVRKVWAMLRREHGLRVGTVEDVRRAVDAWRPVYNARRPHQALAFRTPAEVRALKLAPLAEAA